MPSLIDLRRRIRSVKNTQQITKAMKMVSAAKLRRAQDRALAARPYATILQQMLANVAEAASQSDAGEHPLLAVREEKRILYIVVTADSGLAGGFNSNINRMAQRSADERRDAQVEFETIGKKGRDYFRRRVYRIRASHVDLYRTLKFEDAEKIAEAVIDLYSKAEIDAVYLFFNEFKSVMASKLTSMRLLPVEVPKSSQPVDYI